MECHKCPINWDCDELYDYGFILCIVEPYTFIKKIEDNNGNKKK